MTYYPLAVRVLQCQINVTNAIAENRMNQFKFAISSKFFACLTIWTIFQTNNIHAQEIPRLNIGVIMPLSGPQKAYGDEAMRGIDIAIDHFALSNPKVAAKIRLSKFDDKSQSKVAGELAEKLYGKKRTHIIIGSISTPSTQEIGISAAKHKRPLISPLATSDELIKKGYVYRTSLDRDLQAQLLGEFALLKLKLKKAAILRDDSDLSKSFSARFSKSFKSRVSKIVATEIYSAGTTDFRIHLNKIKSSNAETVLLPAYTSTAGTIMQQAKEIGLKVKFLGTDSWDTSTLNQAAAPFWYRCTGTTLRKINFTSLGSW